MNKYKAIPDGYMTVGEVAKKMDITVRTLQHYDKEGLLSPSAMSEGGRRLYTDKDCRNCCHFSKASCLCQTKNRFFVRIIKGTGSAAGRSTSNAVG